MKVSLKAARVNADLTQVQAAEKAGISREQLQYIESREGSVNIRYSTLLALCDVYGCTPSDIFLPTNYALSEV